MSWVPQGEKDWEKYEVARKLKTCVDSIRSQYQQDLKSKQMKTRQRAVALYFIDKVMMGIPLGSRPAGDRPWGAGCLLPSCLLHKWT